MIEYGFHRCSMIYTMFGYMQLEDLDRPSILDPFNGKKYQVPIVRSKEKYDIYFYNHTHKRPFMTVKRQLVFDELNKDFIPLMLASKVLIKYELLTAFKELKFNYFYHEMDYVYYPLVRYPLRCLVDGVVCMIPPNKRI